MTNKAASQVFWIIITAVILTLGLILLFPLFGETKNLAEDLTDYRICKDGNLAMVKTRIKFFDWVVAEQGVKHCKTERVKIRAGNEYEAIANKMALCWDSYLEGKEEVFETNDANYCAFCSILEFEDKNKKLNDLSKYLANNRPKGKEQKTYIEYLTDVEVTSNNKEAIENLDLKDSIEIDASKKYAVAFVMYKDAYPSLTNLPKGLTALGGTSVGAISGFTLMTLSYFGGLGLCSTFIGCSAGIFLITGASGLSGYLIGSDRSADWRARILLTEYDKQKLEQLKCTRLDGLDYLKIQKR